jgi:hypothetical protein
MKILEYKKTTIEIERNNFFFFKKQKFIVESRIMYVFYFLWFTIFYIKYK